MKSLKLFTSVIVITSSLLFSGFTAKEADKAVETSTAKTYTHEAKIISASDAKKLLVEGNARFVDNKTLSKDISEDKRKDLAVNGQYPFAIIVGCSDSRVPPEIIFDQGLGDIFVIRDAGNVVDPIALGSVEYGAVELGAPLIVVLGHEQCGAVKAAVDGEEVSENIDSIINEIKPSVEKAKASGATEENIYDKTENENIKNTIDKIKGSPVIKKLLEEKKVEIVGAKYYMEEGKVEFME